MNCLIYDCEIVKAIPNKGDDRLEGIDYCDGWRDFENMGISVICACEWPKMIYRVFLEDNFPDFESLAEEVDYVVGFNSIPFDNELLAATTGYEIPEERSFDILRELWAAVGLGPKFVYPTHMGYGLDDVGLANGLGGKSGSGAKAPVWWQRGSRGKVIDYCLRDVILTVGAFSIIQTTGELADPKTGSLVEIRHLGEPPREPLAA